jgi:O-antigen/teichoic acid export membrane protein
VGADRRVRLRTDLSAPLVETRAAKVAVASSLSMGLSIALQLVSVPVCLRYWGQEKYGLWLALFALANVLRTPEVGFNAYIGNELNVLYHRDPAALRRTLASAVWGALLVAALLLLCGALIAVSGALATLLGIPDSVTQAGRAGLALAVLLLGFAATGPYLGCVDRLLIPAGMNYQAIWWFMGLQIAQSASLVVAALLDCSLVEAALLFATTQAGLRVATALYIARQLPDFFPWWRHPSWASGLRDFARSAVLVGANLLTQAGTNGIVMLVASGLGAAAVPAFTTVRTLTNLWTSLGQVLLSPLFPELVRYHAHGDARKLAAALETHWLVANVLVNGSVLASLPFLDDVYHLWTGGQVALDPVLLCAMLIAIVAASPGALIVLYLTGINDLRAVTVLFAVRGLVPLGVGLALLPSLGAVGVGVGVALGEFLGPVVVGGFCLRRQLRRFAEPHPPRWLPSAVGSAITAAYLVYHAITGPGFGVSYAAALFGMLASAVWGWRGISEDVRERMLRLLRRRPA